MVEHVRRRALAVRGVERVLVATDHEAIAQAVRAGGGEVVMTSPDHPSGSDRVWEAVAALPVEVIVNVQGDEPLLDPGSVQALLPAFGDPAVQVATLACPGEGSGQEPSEVKVEVDPRGDALDFTRAPPTRRPWLRHIGVYAYRRAALQAFCARTPGPRERAERLEQLRFLEYGVPVRVVQVPQAWPSVDTPADLERVRALLRARVTPTRSPGP